MKILLVPLLVAAGLGVGLTVASAHECSGDGPDATDCHDTPQVRDWRPNYVPLFDITKREEQGPGTEGDRQRHDAQRWKDECHTGDVYHQFCAWAYGGNSAFTNGEPDPNAAPNELHVGFAATHCFLLESQHDCEAHDASHGEGVHDAHGGALYVDVCLAANPEGHYCDDGLKDTQAGVTIVDHLDCPMGCFDEYHVVRPLDTDYTSEQAADSVEAAGRIAEDPKTQVCGYPEHSVCP